MIINALASDHDVATETGRADNTWGAVLISLACYVGVLLLEHIDIAGGAGRRARITIHGLDAAIVADFGSSVVGCLAD